MGDSSMNGGAGSMRRTRLGVIIVGLCVSPLAFGVAGRTGAQDIVSGSQSQDLNVAPVYEGWEKKPDGSINMLFGYMNRNWDQAIDAPVGADNAIEPGGPDRGQPTHFLPRRNLFVFKVAVPSDFGSKELVWTLTTNGRTQRAYGTLRPGYLADDSVIAMNHGGGNATGNRPPTLTIEGATTTTARVGEPITLTAIATDDGIPKTRALPPLDPRRTAGLTVQNATGLRLAWLVYRGAGDVSFDPAQFKVYVDMREASPWTPGWQVPPIPPGNRWVTRVVFREPGRYVLRCLAHDGMLPTYQDVTVVVS
jgi:hypothetical protein